MKKIITLIVLVLLLTSCGTTVYQLKSSCDKINTDDLFRSITSLLLEENFLVKQSDTRLGYMQAETVPSFNIWLGMNEIRMWTFQHVQGKIIASAKVIYTKQNVFGSTTGGSETYYNDNAHSDWTWYWNVRNGLEKLCGDKIVIEKKKVN